MSLNVLSKDQLPSEAASKLRDEEAIHHFGYIDAKGGGCANASTAKQWVLITNQRIIFEASVKEGTGNNSKYIHQSGSIPIVKVSYVGTATAETVEGCSKKKTTNIRINSSGGEISLAIPTKDEATRIQEVIDELISVNK